MPSDSELPQPNTLADGCYLFTIGNDDMRKPQGPDGPDYEPFIENLAEHLARWDSATETEDAFARRLVGLFRMDFDKIKIVRPAEKPVEIAQPKIITTAKPKAKSRIVALIDGKTYIGPSR